MYDGRVGAALCYMIRTYLESENNNLTEKKEHDDELKFGWNWGQGNPETRKNRDPNNRNSSLVKFEEITERNRELHFISNIKANWLLELIAEKVEIPEIENKEKAFALQTAFFMLGEKIPDGVIS
ncbi:MAG TPA: hypothetical protein PLB59_12940 [Bacteroidales bacterium]|jgi:hypothetical protein|nr:hypothetical protein [Bacteroidales bacterium]HPI31206.1 hypothetical protein [Bacteroidales bacterium]HQN17332.1 hypothetical protein [Bacteroidales bacterium]HQP16861.1 hypothetical protein [Bacteroidales bacterium]